MGKTIQVILNPWYVWKFHYCVARILGKPIFLSNKSVCKKKWYVFFSGRECSASASPKRIKSLIKPLLQNRSVTNFQYIGPWEGPIHFSRFVPRVHNCSKLFQRWSWSQEKKKHPFTRATFSFSSSFLYLLLPLSLSLPLFFSPSLYLFLSLSLFIFLFHFLLLHL